MQNKIKNYFQVQNINKKKKPSNETSSPNIVLPRQTFPNTIRFLPPRDRPIHTTISRDIVYKKEKEKENLEREGTRSCYRNLPTTDIFIRAEEAARAVQFPRLLEMNIQGFLKSGRCLLWKSITLRPRVTSLKPLKQGTLLITCYPAVHDQRSPRKIFAKRIETYTSDTLSKRHCVAVYYRVWLTLGEGRMLGKERKGRKRKKKKGETGIRRWMEVDRLGRWRDTCCRVVLMDRWCRAMGFGPRDRSRDFVSSFSRSIFHYILVVEK